ncbi:hypothetical protein NDU88_008188 [Pleurodeles waltl]|uniref:Uncharacterized protein n=1 Tax=Pleurodeles waltl TaxID=8319 RepID=A0AAV7QTZ1_PLEWA|nr:hypothetical protein NDU88_008188 [Pleurodeles waltl]
MMDKRSEDQEIPWCRGTALEEQHIELQVKQEDLGNRSCHNNMRIQRVPRDQEVSDIVGFVSLPFHVIWGDPNMPPLVLNRAHSVASAPHHPDTALDILE